jgi:iron complex outermembrane receptor protein
MLPGATVPYSTAFAQQSPSAEAASSLDEVVVTGSRIRGAAPVGSSVIGLERADIENASGVTVDRIIKEVPQVYDLGVSESSRGQSGGAGNIVWSNAINLHGIGPYATLVLVDGHRTVSNGRSVDPSIVPSLGLERIEILPDGSSAVYGSDAIAGVVNLVPRRSLDGIDTTLSYGVADQFSEFQAGIAGGKVWDSGQFMVAYEHAFRGSLNGDDRSYFTSDQRASGGGDYRTTQCNPGTINTTGAGANTFAIPATGVTPATAATLIAGTANRCDLTQGQDILPEQKYNSINATFTQRFNDWMEVFADGFYSKREFVREPAYAIASRMSVPNTNAFYVQPPGTTTSPTLIDYNFSGDLPRDTQTGSSENWEVTPGLRFNLPHKLRLEALVTYGKSNDQSNSSRGVNNTALATALASNNPAIAFDPYGLHRTSAATLAAISDQIFLAPTLNTFTGYELRLDGPIVDLPGGSLRFATGYEGQKIDTSLGSARGTPGTAAAAMVYRDFSRSIDSAYLELLVPIVGDANAITGVTRLEFTAAVRYDEYDDVGSTTNPKFGVNYAPIDSLKIRASYGTSFRAPLISEIYGNSNALFGQSYVNPAGGPALLGFALSGKNENLKPEEATTWTAGFDWKPLVGTSLSLTFFDVTYENQVANYLSNTTSLLALEPEFAGTGIILHGTEAGNRTAYEYNVNGIPLARGSFPGGNPQNATLFVDGRNNNLGTSITEGIDLQFNQRWSTDDRGVFSLNVAGSFFTKYEVSLTPNGTSTDRLNTIYYPLSFKGRATGAWQFGSMTAQVAYNYVTGYDNNIVTPIQKVSAYTPIDVSLMFAGDEVEWMGSFGKGLSIGFEVRNFFDQDPPYVNIGQSGNGGGGFDPTAANPIGQLFSLRLRKNWR